MKKYWKLLLTLPLLGLLLACSTFSPVADNPAYNRVMENKILVVGMSGDQPPFNFNDGKKIIGLDVDIAKLIAKDLGVELKIVTMPFSELQASLKSQKIDVIMSAFSQTAERQETLLFSTPYAVTGQSLIFKREKGQEIKNTTGFNNEKVRIVAIKDSSAVELSKVLLDKSQITVVESYEDAIQLIKDDKADAFIGDLAHCKIALLKDESSELLTLRKPLNIEKISIALNKNELMLKGKISATIDELIESKEIVKIEDKWFKNPEWLSLIK